MNTKLKSEINSEEEMNLYEWWKVLVKRRKILIGISLVPLVMVTIISFSVPRNYRGEAEMSYPVSPSPNIAKLIGDIDNSKKDKIFKNTAGEINSILISRSGASSDKIKVIVDAKTADIIPQAFKDIVDYIDNIPEIAEEIARINEETNFKIRKLIEARKANLIFLSQMTDMIKKRQLSLMNINPADLIKKDAEISLEIMKLQQAKTDMIIKKEVKELNTKVRVGSLGPLSIAKRPSNSQIKLIIIFTGLLSFLTGIFVVFFLEYIDRIKARENK